MALGELSLPENPVGFGQAFEETVSGEGLEARFPAQI